ncbi:DNA-binding response regulator [Photobacterium gaetbulicola]|uniref:Putative transcriptional regulator CpxR n=1 Tax=Photobacterium gaetbulicola Gung47 TaxID=658445 RepID=A0A0C5WFT6_9GAMM|nr:response regulator transcription factor [Photobacterium gaetbulicola]AJR06003.1 putative transcriptional regulator CpxR [Photobacterium gaetbulicola Gung47]PSU13354.1 DNA-binding response regulator [Photobacterium gaetbulicola]
MSKILVVDDDIVLCELLQEVLEDEGYEVHCAHCGKTGLAYLEQLPVDLVLLDVMLPYIDGMQLARRICQRFATPIIMLTALGDEASLLDGLQAGADHYMAKPFKVPELLARIKATMRRVGLEKQRSSNCTAEVEITEQLRRIPLTDTESDLLEYLVRHNGIVVSKAELQKAVLKKELSPFDRNLDMHISNIRRKIVQSGLPKQHIKTVRGKGYSFLEVIGT